MDLRDILESGYRRPAPPPKKGEARRGRRDLKRLLLDGYYQSIKAYRQEMDAAQDEAPVA